MSTAYWSHILNNFYLLTGEEPPVCIPCDKLLTAEHIFTKLCGFAGVQELLLLWFFFQFFFCKIVVPLVSKSTNVFSKM